MKLKNGIQDKATSVAILKKIKSWIEKTLEDAEAADVSVVPSENSMVHVMFSSTDLYADILVDSNKLA
jgi:prephenate dehydratase